MPSVPNPLFSAPLPTDSAIDSLYPPTQSLNPWQLIRALTPTNPLYLRHSTHYSQPRIASSSPVKDDGTIWLREPHLLVSDKNAAGKQTISYLSSNWCQPTTVEAGDILTVKWAASSTEWEAIQIQISARVYLRLWMHIQDYQYIILCSQVTHCAQTQQVWPTLNLQSYSQISNVITLLFYECILTKIVMDIQDYPRYQ